MAIARGPVLIAAGAALLATAAYAFARPKPKPRRRSQQPSPGDVPPDYTGQPVPFGTGDPSKAGYPWEEALIDQNNYPTPGMFFIVGQETTGNNAFTITTSDGLVRRALGSAMAMAGNFKADWVNPNSSEFQNPNAKRLRDQMRDLINCSLFNDQAYGQTDPQKAGAAYAMGPQGRGLNWLPNHADNIGRLAQGLAPIRTTNLQGQKLSNLPPGVSANRNMQLWIPPVDLSFLQSSVPESSLTVTTGNLAWSDGSSVLNPPPMITSKGVLNLPNPGAQGWGCP